MGWLAQGPRSPKLIRTSACFGSHAPSARDCRRSQSLRASTEKLLHSGGGPEARRSHLMGGMLAAALIPLIFIVGLLVLFLLGAWPVSTFASVVIIALLGGIAIALVRMTSRTNRAEHLK